VKLTELPEATRLVNERHLLRTLADTAEIGIFDVFVGGKYASESLKAVCRAPFIAECNAQIAAIDRQLAELGVEVD
jgi:hypothetical protein